MIGQLCLAHRRRESDTSSATALRSMAGSAAATVVLSLALVRMETFRAFVEYELPRLSHGDLLFSGIPAEAGIRFAAVNFSVYGMVTKLRELGAPGLAPFVADAVTWVFTAAMVVLVWRAAARATSRAAVVQIGLAALVLAATRSPFVPSAYGALGALWLLTLLAADVAAPRRAAAFAAAFVALSYVVPDAHPGFPPPPVRLVIGLVQQLAVFALAFAVLGSGAGRPRSTRASAAAPA